VCVCVCVIPWGITFQIDGPNKRLLYAILLRMRARARFIGVWWQYWFVLWAVYVAVCDGFVGPLPQKIIVLRRSTGLTTGLSMTSASRIRPKQSMRLQSFLDIDKEADRKHRRTVYNSLDWKRHRESSRYFMSLVKMPFSHILRSIYKQVFGVTLWSVVIVLYNMLTDSKLLSKLSLNPGVLPKLSFPSLPIMLISPSLGLLLMFRTNASYDRWIKARVIWAAINTKSIDLMRAGALWIRDPSLQRTIVRYVTAYSRCIRWYLNNSGDEKEKDVSLIRKDLEGVLNDSELNGLLAADNKILHITSKLSAVIIQASLATPLQVHMEKLVGDMNELMNHCDMIYSSPIPLIYTRQTLRFLLLWLLVIPMTLHHEFKSLHRLHVLLMVPAISFIVSLLLFGIEELGVQIEEPFSLLPLGVICKKIQESGQQILNDLGLSWFDDET
jgi:putative membrane protein